MHLRPTLKRPWRGSWPAAIIGLVLQPFLPLTAAELSPALQSWLQAQTNLHTWSAQVIQTRALQALTHPLQSTGRVWFSAPRRFRWEIGQPPRTIALRQPDALLVVYPRLQRAERYSLGPGSAGPWKETLALLEAGFPRSQADLEERFAIISQSVSNQVFTLDLKPKSARARRMMPSIKILFTTNDWMLRATELRFADGSTLRNEFLEAQLNPLLPEGLFHYDLPPDCQVVEPLARP